MGAEREGGGYKKMPESPFVDGRNLQTISAACTGWLFPLVGTAGDSNCQSLARQAGATFAEPSGQL